MPIKIGIVGLGNVGKGVVRLLTNQNKLELFEHRTLKKLQLVGISARDKTKHREVDLSNSKWFDNPADLVASDIDIFVETIGGDGIAYELVRKALESKKHVVTANKALIASKGIELVELAEKNGVSFKFEAAVAGGIPIIKAIKEGLAANNISKIIGILNGTCNYILSQMHETGKDFWEVLNEAQMLGYAESEPSLDIDGIDTAHKLSILSSLAFGTMINFPNVHIEGIRDISILDIKYAKEFGYVVKLLAIAKIDDGKLKQTVYPAFVPEKDAIASISGVNNIVMLDGDYIGQISFVGRGAGTGPTASAIVSDILDIATGRNSNPFGVTSTILEEKEIFDINHHIGSYYLRVPVIDKVGVIAEISDILRDREISIAGIWQKLYQETKDIQVVIITHPVKELAIRAAIEDLCSITSVTAIPKLIRVENSFDI